MASVAGVADIGMSIGSWRLEGTAPNVGGPRASFLGWCIEFDRQICWITGRTPMP
jgi:hypothetical protein